METPVSTDSTISRSGSFVRVTIAYVLAFAVAAAWLVWGPATAYLWLDTLIADLLATLVIFAFSRFYGNSSFYDAYWSVVPPALFIYWWAAGDVGIDAVHCWVIAIVIGVVWAVAMNLAKWVERTTFPYAVILQSIPILAVVPLIGFWFGYDFIARTIVCVLIALFPIVSNTLFGLQSVDRGARELFQLQKATRWIVLRKLELPTALPAMFAGMRISAGLSIVGAIVGDFFFQRGTPGIGALIAKYQSRLQSPELFASILLASLFGVAIFLFFGWLARRAVGKWYDFG